VRIQGLLADGFAPVQIKELLHTSYYHIQRYATGDAYNMCRFTKEFTKGHLLDQYRTEIIRFLDQNATKKEIFERLLAIGYKGKMTALKDYCRELINELGIQYASRKNTIGVTVKPNQKPEVHYVKRQDVFKYLWSCEKPDDVKISQEDIDYLFKKYPC